MTLIVVPMRLSERDCFVHYLLLLWRTNVYTVHWNVHVVNSLRYSSFCKAIMFTPMRKRHHIHSSILVATDAMGEWRRLK